MRAWMLYSGLRLAVFADVFALLLMLRIEWWLAALTAALIGFSISYIFFPRLRSGVAEDLARHNARAAGPRVASDNEAREDAALEDEGRRET